MATETKTCQNCKAQFTIEPDDFSFYTKIKVPPPTFCPDCRMQRRFTWRNERTLYHGKCAATGKNFLTMFSPESNMKVFAHDYWWSDAWDQGTSAMDYDFSKPFFIQFQELLRRAPLPNLANTNVVRTEYGNHNADCKDCYLIFASFTNDNVHYSAGAVEARDSMDLYTVLKIELGYEDVLCDNLNRVFFSYNTGPGINAAFLKDCVNVNDSLGCVNLRSKSHHIFNRPYSKEEYEKEIKKYDLGSYRSLQEFKKTFAEFEIQFPRRYAAFLRSVNVTGDMLGDAKNCHYCFDGYGNTEDVKFGTHIINLKDSYDGYGFGAAAELLYEGVDSGINGSRYKVTVYTHSCHDVEYTYCCHNSSYLFGCVGLRSRQYCILNKQYSKEEYEALVPRILKQMQEMPYVDRKGRRYGYGEFFPQEISPFAYNETIAQEYFPLTEDVAKEKGFTWRPADKKSYEITTPASKLPDHIKDVEDDILKDVIGCAHAGKCSHQCTVAFKIIPKELEFYRRFNLALPRLCSNCRHYERLAQRNPFHLWHRKCECAGLKAGKGTYANTARHFHGNDHCPNEFETAFAPDRPDLVYCEQCYTAEVA